MQSVIARIGRSIFVVAAAATTFVISIPLLLLIVSVVALLGLYVISQLIPVASAEVLVREVNAKVKLEMFFVLDDETQHSGRYLTVSTPSGMVSKELSWASQKRISIYLAGADIAVLAPGDEYLVQAGTTKFVQLPQDIAPDSWQYLGAFDGRRHLAFFPATELTECVPGGEKRLTSPRIKHRESRCQSPN